MQVTDPKFLNSDVAQNAGRSVGLSLAHSKLPKERPKHFIPVFWSAMGQQLRYCGNPGQDGYDDLVLKGEPENSKFAAYYTRGDTVVAVATMGMDPIMVKSAELMLIEKMPGKSELKGGLDILGVDV